ncbi:aldo/keto reductase [Chengkuizengella axinellae]|uniref:Aldo/keto reductase n=1 Tax=Chengkuizengella axinellae TaxID=3064388 RepID=A0ABT9IZS6_9BACL|nr:aldo/keto reductase [Chengkuizengella sp. 2205SS18-9]MDP5274827.1 aldo/keto reductase [Chengkuizengella sp. 2205SS18-9]
MMQKQLKRTLGKSEIEVSALGLGCWAIGGPFLLDGKQDGWGDVNDTVSEQAIHAALEHGVNFFDTSDAYGTGHSEKILGKALKGQREKVVIASKFGFTYNEETRELTGQDTSAHYIRKACELSLSRLQTDYIDLYQLHLWSLPEQEIDSVIETLEKLQKDGYIRDYGWSTGDTECARYFAEHSNGTSILHPVNVFGYNKEMIEICEKHNLASINSNPLAMGLLSGKFNSESKLSSDDVRGSGHDWVTYFKNGKPDELLLEKLDAIREILRSDGRTLVQGALAWIWAKSEQNIPIPGFKTPEQVIENAKAMTFGPLSQNQIEEIDELFKAPL